MYLSQEYPKVCHLSLSPALGCFWLYKKNHQQIGLYIRIALRDLKVSYSDVGVGGVAVNTEHPVQLGQLEEQHHFVDNVDLEQMLSFILWVSKPLQKF